jgi:hypothetical protein
MSHALHEADYAKIDNVGPFRVTAHSKGAGEIIEKSISFLVAVSL